MLCSGRGVEYGTYWIASYITNRISHPSRERPLTVPPYPPHCVILLIRHSVVSDVNHSLPHRTTGCPCTRTALCCVVCLVSPVVFMELGNRLLSGARMVNDTQHVHAVSMFSMGPDNHFCFIIEQDSADIRVLQSQPKGSWFEP